MVCLSSDILRKHSTFSPIPRLGTLIALEKAGENWGLSTTWRYASKSLICSGYQIKFIDNHRMKRTSSRSKNLWPPSTLLGIPSLCKALSTALDNALKRTTQRMGFETTCVRSSWRVCEIREKDARRTTKSPHPSMPPMLATSLFISTAIKDASVCSDIKERSTGTEENG
jgi:hypothetical protein